MPCGPAQDFNALLVEQGGVGRAHVRVINFILVRGDGRFLVIREVSLADAAQGQGSDIAFAAGVTQRQARREVNQFIAVVQVQFLELVPAESGDGYAYVLEVLFTLLRGDHYFLKNIRAVRRFIGCGGRAGEQRCEQSQDSG